MNPAALCDSVSKERNAAHRQDSENYDHAENDQNNFKSATAFRRCRRHTSRRGEGRSCSRYCCTRLGSAALGAKPCSAVESCTTGIAESHGSYLVFKFSSLTAEYTASSHQQTGGVIRQTQSQQQQEKEDRG